MANKKSSNKKKNKIRMQSTESSHFYTKIKSAQKRPTKRNPTADQSKKLAYKMFDPTIRKHVMYKEAKIKT